jgi:hypothetical protein
MEVGSIKLQLLIIQPLITDNSHDCQQINYMSIYYNASSIIQPKIQNNTRKVSLSCNKISKHIKHLLKLYANVHGA